MRLILGLLIVGSCAMAANARTFRGKVVDAESGEPLIGATVQVAGTPRGAATDFDGNFEVEADADASFIFKYVAYKELAVAAADVPEEGWVVSLAPDNTTLGEVTVTAQARQDVDTAILSKARYGLTMQTGVSAQQIQRTQDKDASEVIKRVPGISIIDDKFVMVRGLSQRYNNVWINGSAVPSSEADSRAFSFDIIPSSQLDNIMIVKSPAPEYPADFSGGFILVNTKDIPERNAFSVSVGGNVNDRTHFRRFSSIKGSKTDFLGFDNGFRSLNGGINGTLRQLAGGVDLTGNGFNNDWSVTQTTPYSDFSLNASLTRFRRLESGAKTGLLGAVNYSYSERSYEDMENSLYGAYDVENDTPNYLRHSTDNQYNTNVRLGAMLNLVYLSADGNNKLEFKNIFNQLGKERYTIREGINAQSDRERSAEYYYSSRTTYNGQFAGHHTIASENHVDWSAGYSFANRNVPDRRRYIETDAIESNRFGLITGNDIDREYTLLKEHIASAALDYSRDFSLLGARPTVKAGGYGEYRTRDYHTRSFIYNWDPANNTLPDGFRYMDIPTLLSTEAYFGEQGLYLLEDVKWRNNYSGNNTLLAAYAAVNLPLGKLNVYAGLRFEHDRMELVSNTRDSEKSPISSFYDYNDVFPSVNATYRFAEEHQLRLAYGKSVNRPEFRELSSSVFYDFDLASDVEGNSDLKASYIHNLDLRYEFYPSQNETVTVALFYKNFKHPIEWTYTVAGGTDLVYSYKNAKGATSYGIELDVKKSLDFIGLRDLSIVFNGALIKSSVDFEEGDMEEDRPMQGQSPYIVNTGLFYQSDRLGLSASLLYNRIGKRIVGVGRSMGSSSDIVRIPDSYEMPRNAVDINVSKRLGRHFEIKFSAKDLLGEAICFKQFEENLTLNDGTVKDVEEVTRKYKPGRNFSLTLSYSF